MRANTMSAARRERVTAPPADPAGDLTQDADYQAWLDARVAAAIEAQDDAELLARRWGPEPEFMLRAAGGAYGR